MVNVLVATFMFAMSLLTHSDVATLVERGSHISYYSLLQHIRSLFEVINGYNVFSFEADCIRFPITGYT